MERLLQILNRILEMVERFRAMEGEMPQAVLIITAALLAFGLLNCLLGFRLLRFWMMLIGFAAGAGGAYLICSRILELGFADQKLLYFGSMVGAGVIVAILFFWLYRVGIFSLAFAMGFILSIYLIHPTSSATFFLCILIGAGLGAAAIRFEKQVIIILSSLLGGILAGYCLSRLLMLEEVPYGLGFCALFVFLGILVQFAFNRTPDADEAEEDRPQEEIGAYIREEDVDELDQRKQRNDFYEEYFHGGDVFDRTTREIRDLTGEEEPEDIHLLLWNQKSRRTAGETGTVLKEKGMKKHRDMLQ